MPHLVLDDRKAALFRRVLVAAAKARPEVSWPIRQLINAVDRQGGEELSVAIVRVDGVPRKAALSAILEHLAGSTEVTEGERREILEILRGCLGEMSGPAALDEVIGDVSEYREKRAVTQMAIAHEMEVVRVREERRFAESKKMLTDRQERDRRRALEREDQGTGTRKDQPTAEPAADTPRKDAHKQTRRGHRRRYAWDLTD